MEDKTSSEINRIRNEARKSLGLGPVEHCCTCGREPGDPYRSYDRQRNIVQGCVDAIHTGKIGSMSNTSKWHNSNGAKEIRKMELKSLKGKWR